MSLGALACGAGGGSSDASSSRSSSSSSIGALSGSSASRQGAGSTGTAGSDSSANLASASTSSAATSADDASSGEDGAVAITASEGGSSTFDSAAPPSSGAASGAGDAAASAQDSGDGGSGAIAPPVPDRTSTIPISSPGAQYKVEGNIPYGPLPAQRLDVIYPANAGPKGTATLPGVVMFHGGGWIQGDKATMSSFYDRFLAHGFLVCNVEYRRADGTPNGAIAPAAVQDALLAAQWFWNHFAYYHVDPTHYVVTGASAGGHLALMVGMATPAAQLGPTSPGDYKIAAIVDGYGPTDVTDMLQRNIGFAVQWLPASTPNRAALAITLSPVTYARKDIPPLITVQGANDTTVPTAESTHLNQLLAAAGADATLHFVAGAGHGFTTPATAWPDAEAAMFGFLVNHGIGK